MAKKIKAARLIIVALGAMATVAILALWLVLGNQGFTSFIKEVISRARSFVPLATLATAGWGAYKAFRGWEAAEATKAAAEAEAKKMATPVAIALVTDDERELVLPYRPLRSQLSRSEVAGVLGMFQPSVPGGRLRQFNLSELSEVFTSGKFSAVLAGDTDILRVPCPDDEFLVVSEELARRELARKAKEGQ